MQRTLLNPTLLLAFALMAIILMMILPMPAWVLDVGLAFSFGLAILIFTITLFVERPLEFSSFPTLLLASLMLRLSLNVSSTKLIIGQGHSGTQAAGQVIEGFAEFIMGGSVFLGLVVFGILMIVNFAVITKGAGRMAEVGARFALDAMPGKQLSIDADLSSGAITHEQAKARRADEQAETTFFGSLDGASKFVKGDAVAGLLITLLNLIMGLAMGIIAHGMPIAQAFETYAILTVGDGLVSQIPALIISIAAALLLARGGTTGSTDLAVIAQIRKYPAALAAVGGLMLVFAIVPGLPFVPFVIGAAILIALSVATYRHHLTDEPTDTDDTAPIEQAPLGDLLDVDDIHIEFAPDLIPMVLDPGTGLDVRIANMRKFLAQRFGLLLPRIRLTDEPSLGAGQYQIRVMDVPAAKGDLIPDRVMILLPEHQTVRFQGIDATEPVYGAPARWIKAAEQDQAEMAGLTQVAPTEVLATHLLEVLRKNFPKLITLRMVKQLIDEQTQLSDQQKAQSNQSLFNDLIPDKVTMELIVAVLRNLVAEHISVRNLPLIVETLASCGTTQPDIATEFVRQKLGHQIISELKGEQDQLPLVQLSNDWESEFETYQIDLPNGVQDVALPPDIFAALTQSVADKIQALEKSWGQLAVITSANRRRFLATLIRAKGLRTPVISFEELGYDTAAAIVGVVEK